MPEKHHTKQPKITIITVTYNCENYIEKTILSIINQTYKNLEYVIVDGGSTDSTLEIINKYKDNISTLISEPDNGVYDAMNKAVKLSTGEWINFMNAGDGFIDDNVIKKVFQKSFGNANFIYGDTIFIDEIKNTETNKKARPISDFWKSLNFNHNSLFCKRSLLINNPFNTFYKIVADSDFIAKHIGEEEFYYADMTINYYTLGGLSNQQGSLRVIERWKLLKGYNFVDEVTLDSHYLNILQNQFGIKTDLTKKLQSNTYEIAKLQKSLEKYEAKFNNVLNHLNYFVSINTLIKPFKKIREHNKLKTLVKGKKNINEDSTYN